MDMNEYQLKAASTAVYPKENGLLYTALGLCGESGEYAEKLKKVFRMKGEVLMIDSEVKHALAGELGDILWYLAQASFELGFTLEQVAQWNLSKLAHRKQQGTLKDAGDNR